MTLTYGFQECVEIVNTELGEYISQNIETIKKILLIHPYLNLSSRLGERRVESHRSVNSDDILFLGFIGFVFEYSLSIDILQILTDIKYSPSKMSILRAFSEPFALSQESAENKEVLSYLYYTVHRFVQTIMIDSNLYLPEERSAVCFMVLTYFCKQVGGCPFLPVRTWEPMFNTSTVSLPDTFIYKKLPTKEIQQWVEKIESMNTVPDEQQKNLPAELLLITHQYEFKSILQSDIVYWTKTLLTHDRNVAPLLMWLEEKFRTPSKNND